MTLLSLVTEKQMNSEDNLYTFTPSCPSSTLYPCLWVLPFLMSLETVCTVEKLPPFSSMLSNFPSAFSILRQTPMPFPSLLQNPKLTLHAPAATAPFFCFHLQKNSSNEFWYSPWLNALTEVSPGPSLVMLPPPHPTNMSLWRLQMTCMCWIQRSVPSSEQQLWTQLIPLSTTVLLLYLAFNILLIPLLSHWWLLFSLFLWFPLLFLPPKVRGLQSTILSFFIYLLWIEREVTDRRQIHTYIHSHGDKYTDI